MSFNIEHRGFAVGREVGECGRWTRLVLGLLGLVYIGTSVAQMGPSATLIGHIASGFLLTAILYIVLFCTLGDRVSHPWLRTVIFWIPAVFILLPSGWGFGVLLYWSLACLVTALSSYGGCEVAAFPSLLFRRQYIIYCPLNAIDLVERRYTQREESGSEYQG